MSVLYILLAASLLVGVTFLGIFFWAVRSGQFDDTGTPPMRMLADDEPAQAEDKGRNATQDKES